MRSLKTAICCVVAVAWLEAGADAQHRGQQHSGRPSPPPPVDTTTISAHDMYWNAVRRNTGPIGFEKATPSDRLRPFPPAPIFGGGFYAPYLESPAEPIYVPVYVPGPVVYMPAPDSEPHAPPPTTAAPPPAPRQLEKFYVIPGCYGGNRPPQREMLPAGCDIENLRVSTW